MIYALPSAHYGPLRHPLVFDRFPGFAGYTAYLAPAISRRDEKGFPVFAARSETPLQSQLEEDVFAEVAATNMAIVKAMGLLASVATDRRPYLSRILEAGLLDFEQID